MFSFLSSPITTVILSIVAPTIAFSSLNLRFFTYRQCVQSVILMLLVGLAAGSFFQFILDLFSVYDINREIEKISYFSLIDAFLTATACLFFFILSERFFTEVVRRKNKSAYLVPSIVFIIISGFFSPLLLNIVLLLYIIFACLDIKRTMKLPKEYCFKDRPLLGRKANKELPGYNIKLKNKPNIYIIMLEAYCSSLALKRYAKVKDNEFERITKEFGFKSYGDIYSNGQNTMSVVYSVFHGELMPKSRTYPSKSFIPTLRDNGYSFEIFDTSTYLFQKIFNDSLTHKDYTTFNVSRKVSMGYTYFGPIFAQSKYMRAIIGGEDPFETDINFDQIYDKFQKRIIADSNNPRLFFMRFGAKHHKTGEMISRRRYHPWVADYLKLYKQSQNRLRQVLAEIKEHDPDALVIAFGDHGMRLYDGLFHPRHCGKKTPQQIMANTKMTMESLALDYFGVPLAIRWPCPDSTDGKVITPVNFFRYIFAALGGGEDLMKQLNPNISVTLFQPSIIVREGRPLDAPVPYNEFTSK